jgi:hypothetical protein
MHNGGAGKEASRWLHWAVRVVVLPTRISSAVPVWTPDLPLAWGVLLNPTRHAGARGARPRARTVPLDRHGGDRSCTLFGPCTLFGSKRSVVHFVRKVHFVWVKRFASKTFVTLLNVKWPFSTRNQTKCTKHFVCVRFIECKVWPQINVCLSVVKGQVERAEFAGWFIIATCKVRALCRETASTL